MDIASIYSFEHEKRLTAEKQLKFDINVIFAAASIMIILLYSGALVYYLLDVLSGFFAGLIASAAKVTEERAAELYASFVESELLENIISTVSYLLSLFIPVLFVKRFAHKRPVRFFPLRKPTQSKNGTFILTTIGLCYSVNLVCNLLLSRFYPTIESSGGHSGVITVVFTFLSAVIIAPLCEELLFRGAFYQTLSNHSQVYAIIISALIFGLAHRNPPSVVNALVCGFCLAVAFARTNSILLSVVIHFANNAFAMFASSLVSDMSSTVIVLVIAFAAVAAILFAITMATRYFVSGKASVLVYDDAPNDTPRMSASALSRLTFSSFFFWFFVLIIAFAISLFYI